MQTRPLWSLCFSYYRGAHVIMAVFDLSKRDSLSTVGAWIDAALKETDAEAALVFLVGAKRDLVSDQCFDAIEPEAIRIANQFGAELWITSAKLGHYLFRDKITQSRKAAVALDWVRVEKKN